MKNFSVKEWLNVFGENGILVRGRFMKLFQRNKTCIFRYSKILNKSPLTIIKTIIKFVYRNNIWYWYIINQKKIKLYPYDNWKLKTRTPTLPRFKKIRNVVKHLIKCEKIHLTVRTLYYNKTKEKTSGFKVNKKESVVTFKEVIMSFITTTTNKK